jgi:cobalt-zinc-cadmium efflux system membrane fusion protein
MKPTRLFLALAAAAVIAGLAGYAYWSQRPAPAPEAAQAGPVRLAADHLRYAPGAPQLAFLKIQPAREVMEPTLEPLPARLAYDENRTTRVYSPVAGRVLRLLAQAGDRVAAGQVLAYLDAPDFAAAQADTRKAAADLAVKQAAYQRANVLHEGGIVADKDLEAAHGDLASSQAEATRAQSRLRNLGRVDENGYALRAPIAGVVAERHINPGQEVRPDLPDPLFVITDTSHLSVILDVPEQDLGKISVGQPLRIEVDAWPEQAFNATLRQIGVVLDPATRRVPVRAELDNRDGRLKPEMYARATPLNGDGRNMISVPNGALVTTGLHPYVFVEQEPGLLVKQAVTVSQRGHETTYLSAGVSAGQRVVTSGALLLDSELGGGK